MAHQMTRTTKSESIYLPELAEIMRMEQLTEKEKLLEVRLRNGQELGHLPGQFVEVSVFGIGEAPISVCSSPTQPGRFELCVRAVGNVTDTLHKLPKGSLIGIRGPFGRGFPTERLQGQDLVFVAGGLGLAPLRSLINYVLDNRGDFGDVFILYGAKVPGELFFDLDREHWAKRDDIKYLVTVDKGDETWTGNVGRITTLIPKVDVDPRRAFYVVVGPPVMYRFVILEAIKRGIREDRIIVSLERRMKCGVGKCGHCQINSKYVCQDGPVFTYAEIRDLQEAL